MKNFIKKITNKFKKQNNKPKAILFLGDEWCKGLNQNEQDYLIMSYITLYDMEGVDVNVDVIQEIIRNIFLNLKKKKIINAIDVIKKINETKLKDLFEYIFNRCYYNEYSNVIEDLYKYIEKNNMLEITLNNIDYTQFYTLKNRYTTDIETTMTHYITLYLINEYRNNNITETPF